MFTIEDTSEEAPKALRLIFETEGDDQIELVYQAIVDAVAHKFHATENREGYFVDTYDHDDNLVSRYFAHRAFQTHKEVFSPTGIHYEPVEGKSVFSLLVPYNDTVDHVRIIHATPDPRTADLVENEVRRFKIEP